MSFILRWFEWLSNLFPSCHRLLGYLKSWICQNRTPVLDEGKRAARIKARAIDGNLNLNITL